MDQQVVGTTQEPCAEPVRLCAKSLKHSYRCKTSSCNVSFCGKVKKVIGHAKICKKKRDGACPLSKQVVTICASHVKRCVNDNCDEPLCRDIKMKLKKQGLQQRIEKDMKDRNNVMAIENSLQQINISTAAAGNPTSGTIEWHSSNPDTDTIRSHVVRRLAQAFSLIPVTSLLDAERDSLVKRAGEIEHSIFKSTTNRSEYYHLLAEEVYKAQREAEEKKMIIENETLIEALESIGDGDDTGHFS